MSEWVHAHPPMHDPQTCKWRRCLPISTAQGKLLEECEPSLFSVKLQEIEFGGINSHRAYELLFKNIFIDCFSSAELKQSQKKKVESLGYRQGM